jgi:hypothetical protein
MSDEAKGFGGESAPSTVPIDDAVFSDWLDGLGGDLSRWSADRRRAAEDLLAVSAPARRRLAESRRLDHMLGLALAPAAAPAALRTAALRLPDRIRQGRSPGLLAWLQALAGTASAPLGAVALASLLVGASIGAAGWGGWLVAGPGVEIGDLMLGPDRIEEYVP